MSTTELASYIQKQLQTNIDANTIAAQLRAAGWQETDITAGFTAAQQLLSPTPPSAETNATGEQLPPPLQQSRMKTGWQLFKQSFRIIKTNPGLSRYVFMSTGITLVIFALLVALYLIDNQNAQLLSTTVIDSQNEETLQLTAIGYIVGLILGYAMTVVTLYYATGLSSHVLSIFKAEQTTYTENIRRTRAKLPTILSLALINTVVAFIINMIQRIRFVGWLVSKIVGVIWSLATTFTVPLVADRSIGGIAATKESIRMFKATWGETITSRVSIGGVFFLIYFVIAIPVTIVLAVIFMTLFGVIGLLIAFLFLVITLILMGVVQSLATNVLNTALYYYAAHHVVPPNFSPELLASVYRSKKK
jgi:hypothetical protein